MDSTSDIFNISDDSDSGLQIDESNCSITEQIDDDVTIVTPNKDVFEIVPLNLATGPCKLRKRKSSDFIRKHNKQTTKNTNGTIREIRKAKRREKHSVCLVERPQYPAEDVLKLIGQLSDFMTDIKYRTCIYCDYIDRISKKSFTAHVQQNHKEKLSRWCSCCNEHVTNYYGHRTVKCTMIRKCPFCKGKKTFFSKKADFQSHINHLKTHCRSLFYPKQENSVSNLEGSLEINGEPCDTNQIITDSALKKDSMIEDEDDDLLKWNFVESRANGTNEKIVKIKMGKKTDNDTKNIKSAAFPLISDDDYIDSEENIFFDKVPRLHISVDGPIVSQFSSGLVTNAVKQVEQLFYGNRLCIICNVLANDAKDLGFHMMKNHSQVTKGKWCHVCNQLVFGLFDHLESHKNDVLKCSLCKNSSTNFVDLRTHILDHALSDLWPGCRIMPKWFLCKKCPKAFSEEFEFNQHNSQH